jgi:hypothetical protein
VSDKRTAMRGRIYVALVLLVPACAASAQHPCANVVVAQERLACYDAAFPPVAGARSELQDLAAQREAALRDFGLDKTQLRESEPERMEVLAPGRIQAKIVHVRENGDGRRTVTLDNEQVWLLTEATSRGWLDSGDAITVREAALGSYMLLTPRGIALRARRLR